jgi:hypothetical protein
MTKFEPGKTYFTRSICDHNCIFSVEVLKRTAKTITALVDGREVKTLRVAPNYKATAEQVAPHGRYSMAALVDADDPTERPLTDWERDAAAKAARAAA